MKKKLSVFLLSVCLSGAAAFAQNANSEHTTSPNSTTAQHPYSVQLNLGTQGIGAEFNYGLTPKLTLRPGIAIVPVKLNNVFEFSDFNSTSTVKADFQNVHLLADYSPFKSHGAFRIVFGAAYFMKANGNIRISPADNYTYGDIVLSPQQVGYVDLDMNWKGIAPYFGLGFGKIIPSRSFNINVDLGTYYLTAPQANITGTGLLEGNESQTGQLQTNIKDYRWLPVVQLNFNFKL